MCVRARGDFLLETDADGGDGGGTASAANVIYDLQFSSKLLFAKAPWYSYTFTHFKTCIYAKIQPPLFMVVVFDVTSFWLWIVESIVCSVVFMINKHTHTHMRQIHLEKKKKKSKPFGKEILQKH